MDEEDLNERLNPGDDPFALSTLDMSGLRRTSLWIPRNMLERALGYEGKRQYVSFHWSPKQNRVFVCDGLFREYFSDCAIWHRFIAHPFVAPHLQDWAVNGKGSELLDFSSKIVPLADSMLFSSEDDARRMESDVATNCILLDRKNGDVYAGSWANALVFHSLTGIDPHGRLAAAAALRAADGDAQQKLIEWLEACAGDPDRVFSLAAVANNFGQHQQALNLLLRCIELCPESDVFHFRLSQTYGSFDRWTEALETCETAIRLQVGAPASVNQVTPDTLLKWKGQCQFNLENYKEAADTYRLLLTMSPERNGEAVYPLFGRCHTKLGHHKEAIVAHENAVGIALNLFLTQFEEDEQADSGAVALDKARLLIELEALGRAYLLARRFGAAVRVLRKVLSQIPDLVRPRGYLMIAYTAQGHHEKAAKELKTALLHARTNLEEFPNDARRHADLAFLHKAMKDDVAAKAHCRRAAELGWRSDPDEDLLAAFQEGPSDNGRIQKRIGLRRGKTPIRPGRGHL
jgi:tetratricopeptide (TPR) repeat protein